MTLTKTETIIRSLGVNDLWLLLEAQAASSNELDAMKDTEIALALTRGQIQGLVLEAEDRQMLVSWQMDGKHALLTAFYRTGTPKGFLSDSRELLERTEGRLREFGVQNIFAGVGYRNPNFNALVKLYGRLGFGPDLLRVGKVI